MLDSNHPLAAWALGNILNSSSKDRSVAGFLVLFVPDCLSMPFSVKLAF